MATAIVTGSSSGFGLMICLELAKQDYEVIATMRNMEKSKVFSSHTNDPEVLERIRPFHVDVTDEVSIARLTDHIKTYESIDILINNAGFAIGGFAEEMEIDEYRRQFETNLFGVMAITKAVLPEMRKQKSGKIINISSISGLLGFPGLSPYASAKYALEGYSESLRLEVKPYGVDVALIEPGSYQTNIWSSGMEVTARSRSEQSPYHDYMKRIITAMEKGKKNHGDPQEVANLVHRLAEEKELRNLRYPVGAGVKAMIALKKFLPWQIWERIVLNQIFTKAKEE